MAGSAKYYDVFGMFDQGVSHAYGECVNQQGMSGDKPESGKGSANWSGSPTDKFSDDKYFTDRAIVYCEYDGDDITYYKLQILLSASRQASAREETLRMVCERCGVDLGKLEMGVVSDGTLNQGIVNGTEYSGSIGGVDVKVSVIGYDALVIVGNKANKY